MEKEVANINLAITMNDRKQTKRVHLFDGWAFKKINYIIFLIGIALIGIGYVIMATGSVNSFQSLTLAPLLLFLGYVVAIPIALIYRAK